MEYSRNGMRECRWCTAILPADHKHFYTTKDRIDGLKTVCISCIKERIRIAKLASKFGISEADYQHLLTEQDNVCAICRKSCITGRNLTVDHDHNTGKVRGLLCFNCNVGIGAFKESAALVATAAKYVSSHQTA